MKHKFVLLAIITLVFMGCKQPMDYKYQDKPQTVDCPGLDKNLMHEALYSFQEDIAAYYNQYTDYRPGTKSYYIEAYSQYVFFGFSGGARFQEIVSNHSLKLLEELKKQPGLFIEKEGRLELNYDHEYVDCLFNSISDEDLRTQFAAMRKVDYLSPQIVAELMRINVLKITQDPYLAMYMCLDAYYQYLADMDLQPKN